MKILNVMLAALLCAAPLVAGPMEQALPGSAPFTSYINLKAIVGGYGALLDNPVIAKLLDQLNVVMPDPEHLITEIGVAEQLHRGVKVGSTFLVRGGVDQAKLLAKLGEHVQLTASVYRGVPLHTGPFKGLSVQVGLVDEDTTLVSFDPSADHPLNKQTIDTLRGTAPSFGTVNAWQPAPRALFAAAMKTEAIIAALVEHGIPSGVAKHIQLATVEATPKLFKVQVNYTLLCDTEANAAKLKTLIKRLHFVLVVLPGFMHGDFHHPFHIVQDGRRVVLVTSL